MRALRPLRALSGTLAAGLAVLAAGMAGVWLLADAVGTPGPSRSILVGHVAAAVAAVLLQVVADRRDDGVASSAAAGVLLVTTSVAMLFWWT